MYATYWECATFSYIIFTTKSNYVNLAGLQKWLEQHALVNQMSYTPVGAGFTTTSLSANINVTGWLPAIA